MSALLDFLNSGNISSVPGNAGSGSESTFVATGMLRQVLQDVNSSIPINVKWFGAKGDGVTNDSGAIQAALNAVIAAGGGEVFFPHGTYKLLTGITYIVNVDTSANVTFRGADTRAELSCSTAIDLLTIQCTNAAANIRRVNVKNMGFRVNHASARGIVMDGASYNQFSDIDISGIGGALFCGLTIANNNNLNNQFENIRITAPGTGVQIKGNYNQFTNLTISEGITGAYGIDIHGTGNMINGFFVRGAGGTGGTATVMVNSDSDQTALMGGLILDSYAIGLAVTGTRHTKAIGVTVLNSQTHGLQVSGGLQGTYNVTMQNSGLAIADTYDHIHIINAATDNTFTAQFVGTAALADYNEASAASRNTLICGTTPNGVTLASVTTNRRPVNWMIGKSTTATRPTLTANDVGFTFMDTTLAANGKPIWWNGTTWVDSTGAGV